MKRQDDRNGVDPMHWLSGGGVMGERIKSQDWSGSSLGAIESWSLSLRTALGICLAFPAPSCVAWGARRAQIYNVPYSQLTTIRRSGALGEDFAHSWSQVWPALHVCFERACRGESVQLEDQPVSFDREAGHEETLMTFSFVPIYEEFGGIGGLMITLLEPSADKLRAELARAKADLDQHAHVISHDFRSPLRTLEQMSRIVLSNHAEQLPPGAMGLLNHVANGASKLALRADMLSRIDVLNHHPLRRQTVDVGALANKVIEELRSAAPDRHIDVVVGELPTAEADFELLRLVLNSLLSNAFKFTRHVEHARIEVSGQREGARVVYSIKDNGAGFDPK
jgi:signal transduction histidine kinase